MSRAILLMLDSLGIGGAKDAAKFGDEGANTFKALVQNRAQQGKKLAIPHLMALGLVNAAQLAEESSLYTALLANHPPLVGSFGACHEISFGKDTPSGHWEITGAPVLFDFGFFNDHDNTFPKVLTDQILQEAGLEGFLGNCHSSGTEIIKAFGEEHIKTGFPIFYTSADSVFQIAAHETYFGLERLYALCEITRRLLADYNIGRVIARPFIGDHRENFERTGNRRDYSLTPPMPTVLDKLIEEKGGAVYSIGKISDIFAHQGITQAVKATGFQELYDKTLQAMEQAADQSIIFTNFVDFDSHFGHRRDVEGYASALEGFDRDLPSIMEAMSDDDYLYIMADHGCDPSFKGSDHTRECIPIMVYRKGQESLNLGHRETFADIGQTIAKQFGLSPMRYGQAFPLLDKE